MPDGPSSIIKFVHTFVIKLDLREKDMGGFRLTKNSVNLKSGIRVLAKRLGPHAREFEFESRKWLKILSLSSCRFVRSDRR